MKTVLFSIVVATFFAISLTSISQNVNPNKLQEQTINTQHELLINNEKFSFQATAGTILLKDKKQNPTASIFYVAYTSSSKDYSRPITFAFTGGPGSSSVWLHLGLLGPKRVVMGDKGELLPPPHQLIDNEYTILRQSDIVFIDPVGTGFSKSNDTIPAEKFYGIDEDIQSIGEFIRLYLLKNKRFSSPKFIIGESYGGLRATGLTTFLQDKYGIYLNGIMMISPFMNGLINNFSPGNDLPYITTLPYYTSTAWYHKKLKNNLQSDFTATLKKSEKFAQNDYALALLKGNTISESEFNIVATQLSEFTGLSVDYIKRKRIRITPLEFGKKLLEKERLVLGRFDSRYSRPEIPIDGVIDYSIYSEPSATIVDGPFSTTLYEYLYIDLNYKTNVRYNIDNFESGKKWNFSKFKGRSIYMGDHLRKSLVKNPYLKVFVATGYFDGATPYSNIKFDFDHIQFENNSKANVTIKYYDAGHMMYIDKAQLIKLSEDLNQFIKSAY